MVRVASSYVRRMLGLGSGVGASMAEFGSASSSGSSVLWVRHLKM